MLLFTGKEAVSRWHYGSCTSCITASFLVHSVLYCEWLRLKGRKAESQLGQGWAFSGNLFKGTTTSTCIHVQREWAKQVISGRRHCIYYL